MKRKILIFCIGILCGYTSVAQFEYYASPADLEKYQTYRENLWSKFLDVNKFGLVDLTNTDPNQNPDHWCVPSHYKKGYGEARDRGEPGIILGWYMAVLATEYELLKRSNQPTNDVIRELYYAMRQYESLDKRAEHFMLFRDGPVPSEAELNGIFTRVFYFNGPEPWDIDYNVDIDKANKKQSYFNSGDQMSGLLLGFRLVKKYLNGVKYYGNDDASANGFDFGIAAQTYAHAMGKWLDDNDFTGKIYNASGTQVLQPTHDLTNQDFIDLAQGGFGWLLDYANNDPYGNFKFRGITGEGNGFMLGTAIESITGLSYFDNKDDCHPEMQATVPILIGALQFGMAYATCDGNQRYQMKVETERVHDFSILFGTTPLYDAWKTYWRRRRSFAIGYKLSNLAISNHLSHFEWEDLPNKYNVDMYIMLTDLLDSGYQPDASLRTTQKRKDYILLKLANPLGSMYKPDEYPNSYTRYWIGKRFFRPLTGVMDKDSYDLDLDKNGHKRHHDGLDFMLLHNLYLLDQDDDVPNNLVLTVGDEDRRLIQFNRPAYKSEDGSEKDEDTFNEYVGIRGPENRGVHADEIAKLQIESTEIIQVNDLRRYYAPHIELKQGFKAKVGSNFSATSTDLTYKVNNTFMPNVPLQTANTTGYEDMSTLNLKISQKEKDYEFNTEFEANTIEVSPNPSNGFVQVKLVPGTQQISITDIMGNEIIKETIDSGTQIWTGDVSSLNSGIYLIEVFDGESVIAEKLQIVK